MTNDDIRALVLDVLQEVAPDIEAKQLDPSLNFRDQFEFDSVDYLNFILILEKRLEIKISEGDYPKLSGLNACVSYLQAKGDA
ncbi:MAG: acyl carrier protein [Gammaproteobacteria bacterium]|nr:MAG: acyl carrier protein [Gammaproteobacteria bacterium]